MARKSLGYVRTEWTCPNCQTRNPGPQKTCSSCGMPQPDDVHFEQAAQEEIITDKAELAKAKAGPDIHCYYCGSRNAADAATCSQCGADLTEGTAREKGRVMGAHRDQPAAKIVCESCGTENEADAAKCVQCGSPLHQPQPETKPQSAAATAPKKREGLAGIGIVGIILILLCIAGLVFVFLSFRTEDMNGTVNNVEWTRTVAIESLQPVEREDWQTDLPAEAIVGVCTEKYHHTQDSPTDNSKEVCGTPYTVDEGSGFAEVVQDCEYEVYETWCKYTVDEWQKIDAVTVSGSNLNPQWPSVGALNGNQREGEREEKYQVVFATEDGQYTYHPGSESEFNQYQPGSRWLLKINTFGAVTDTEPAR